MTNGWGGSTPVQFNEPGVNLEVATGFTANTDITISAIRVWAGLTTATSGRKGRIWSSTGTLLTDVVMPDSLPTINDYTTYTLASPLDIPDGTTFYVSYDTIQYYGAITSAYPQDSSDTSLTATAGRVSNTRGSFPTTPSTAYFGIDVVFTIDTGGNNPPDITGVSILRSDGAIQATATVDDESPSTVTLNWNWGDGTSTNTGAGVVTSSHTYSASGQYAVLVTATDSGGKTDVFAAPVTVTIGVAITASEDWITDILDAVVSDVQSSGYFDKVQTHEPKRAPHTGLTAAIWMQALIPLAEASGLASTSAVLVLKLRMYMNMLREPQDLIDPEMIKATSNIIRRYHDDFDFEGLIRNVDLLGRLGVPLSAESGYLEVDSKQFRIMDITVPCVINDVWPQVN